MDSANKPRFFYGWVVVAACFAAAFSYGLFWSFGIFFKPLQTEFGWSYALTSSVHSIHLGVMTFSNLAMGWVTDRRGPRLPLVCGALFIGTGFALCSQIDSIRQLYLFYGIASLGSGVAWSLATTTVQRWFVQRRGLTLGLVSSGIGAGTLVMASISNLLISTYGWRTTYLIIGAGMGIALFLAALVIEAGPEKRGLKPYEVGESDIAIGKESTNGQNVWGHKSLFCSNKATIIPIIHLGVQFS